MTALTPSKQVESFIAKFDAPVARLAQTCRAALKKRFFGTAFEIVYDGYNALAIGWSTSERTSDTILSLAIFARGVNLYFMYGVGLPDPKGLLQGKGNQGRFIRLETPATLDQPGVAALIRAAIKDADPPLPKSGRGPTIVRFVSKKQKPRRRPRSG